MTEDTIKNLITQLTPEELASMDVVITRGYNTNPDQLGYDKCYYLFTQHGTKVENDVRDAWQEVMSKCV